MSKVFTISGSSGFGKTTIIKAIMDNELISVTTREPRANEIRDVTYYYKTQEEYADMFTNGEFAEWSSYYGHGTNYGLTYDEIDSKLLIGDAYFICDYKGMLQMKDLEIDIVSIFIYCTRETAELNMKNRGDSEASIAQRLSTYDEEVKNMHLYDHVIFNEYGKLEESIAEARRIIGFNNG